MQPEHLRSGGSFLIEESLPADTFTAEDLTEEHAAIAETVDRFWDNEIAPNLDAIQAQRPGAARSVMKKAAGLGLMGLFIPERFGGMELDLVSGLVVAEHTARDGSYSIWEGGHTGIGTLPLVYFGTEEQKQRYLPRLARLDMLAAYALTEPQAGSDALAVRTRADLSPDGRHYVLNGQKMWISNASDADLFTVFAKVGGDRFTAFLVERGFEGLRVGAEEKKMGLRGSSTTALYLDEVPIPVENVLGEIGRGHVIAFNILNIGRLKMGASNVGAAKDVLKHSISYAKARHAFGSPIASFGAIQHKLAEMAIRIFATESIVWRTAGSIQDRSEAVSGDASDAAEQKLKAVEEFAIECSMVKVFGSEMLDYVVDEGVQIHGGYGYHEDYIVERAYRDSRIHRIFEGTNEINRLLIPRMLLKRDRAGRLRLAEHLDRASASQVDREPLANAKTIIKTCLGLALRAHPEDLDLEQEILMLIADMLIDTYAMESVALRVRKGPETAGTQAIQSVFLADRMARIEFSARRLLAACSSDSNDRSDMERLGRLASTELTDTIRLRRRIAETLIESDRYAF